jgi:hypothetical protein
MNWAMLLFGIVALTWSIYQIKNRKNRENGWSDAFTISVIGWMIAGVSVVLASMLIIISDVFFK